MSYFEAGHYRDDRSGGLLPNAHQIVSRVGYHLTCPAKAYQVEVESSACVTPVKAGLAGDFCSQRKRVTKSIFFGEAPIAKKVVGGTDR